MMLILILVVSAVCVAESRSLDLLDRMANWGHRKNVLGEMDVFRVKPYCELYGHNQLASRR